MHLVSYLRKILQNIQILLLISFCFQFWFRLLAKWPLWALHAIGQMLGWVAWLISPSYRKRFLENAATAGLKFSQVLGAVGQAGSMSSELPRLWLGQPVPVTWANDSLSVLRQAYAPGKGVLLLTPHLGCFEVTAQAITDAFSQAHGPLTVLYRPSRKAGLADVMESSRGRPGLEPVPTTMAGVRQMIKALRALGQFGRRGLEARAFGRRRPDNLKRLRVSGR
jgi:KDO2-lipid IV(A) lauroyltransferase